jgi:hypothetical protein
VEELGEELTANEVRFLNLIEKNIWKSSIIILTKIQIRSIIPLGETN